MENLVEKLSSYNLHNYLFPGAVMCYLINAYWEIDILGKNIVESLFIYYFIGMVTSRFGSIVIEPILKTCKWVEFAPYDKYVIASKTDEKLEGLSESNNTYRTMLSMFLLLVIGKFFIFISNKFTFVENIKMELIILGLIVLFTYAYKKQTKYIKDRVEKNIEGEK